MCKRAIDERLNELPSFGARVDVGNAVATALRAPIGPESPDYRRMMEAWRGHRRDEDEERRRRSAIREILQMVSADQRVASVDEVNELTRQDFAAHLDGFVLEAVGGS